MRPRSPLPTAAAVCLLFTLATAVRAQTAYRAGTITLPTANTFTVSFPVPLPTASYAVSLQPVNTPTGFQPMNKCTYFDVVNKTPAGFQVEVRKCMPPGGLVTVAHLSLDWIAIPDPCTDSANVSFVTGLSSYLSAIGAMTDTAIDFSLDCSGASTHSLYQEVAGNYYEHCDEVTFTSWGVSNQDFPSGSCTPFRGLSLAYIAGIGADHGGPEIQSSAGGLNYAGYDAIEADFTATVGAAGVEVSPMAEPAVLDVYGPDGTVTHSYPIPASTSPAFYGVVGACIKAIRISPSTWCNLPLNTALWGMAALHFAE